jgi:hypothetical protein
MGHPLVDIGYTMFYFIDGNFQTRNPNVEMNKGFMKYYIAIMAFAPYWWRFWQCIHKAYVN